MFRTIYNSIRYPTLRREFNKAPRHRCTLQISWFYTEALKNPYISFQERFSGISITRFNRKPLLKRFNRGLGLRDIKLAWHTCLLNRGPHCNTWSAIPLVCFCLFLSAAQQNSTLRLYSSTIFFFCLILRGPLQICPSNTTKNTKSLATLSCCSTATVLCIRSRKSIAFKNSVILYAPGKSDKLAPKKFIIARVWGVRNLL